MSFVILLVVVHYGYDSSDPFGKTKVNIILRFDWSRDEFCKPLYENLGPKPVLFVSKARIDNQKRFCLYFYVLGSRNATWEVIYTFPAFIQGKLIFSTGNYLKSKYRCHIVIKVFVYFNNTLLGDPGSVTGPDAASEIRVLCPFSRKGRGDFS